MKQQSLSLFHGAASGNKPVQEINESNAVLIFSFTDSYATSRKQQAVPLVHGVASGNKPMPGIGLFLAGVAPSKKTVSPDITSQPPHSFLP